MPEPKDNNKPIDTATFTAVFQENSPSTATPAAPSAANASPPGIGISTAQSAATTSPEGISNPEPPQGGGVPAIAVTAVPDPPVDNRTAGMPTFAVSAVNNEAGNPEDPPTIQVLAQSIDSSNQTTDDAELDATVTVDKTDQSDNTAPTTADDDFIYPLSTKKFELNNFFNTYYRDSDAKRSIDAKLHDYFQDFSNSPPYKLINQRIAKQLIKQMPFSTYMNFRNYQMSQMQHQAEQQSNDLQQRLNLMQTSPDGFKDNSPWWEKFAPKWLNQLQGKLDPKESLAARIEYYKKLTALFKDVSISQDPDDPKVPKDPSIYYIKRGIGDNQKTLVTIKDEGNNQLSFKISSKLDDKEKQDAISIMLDQTTRQRERSASTKLEISGYLGNPKMALQIYQSALLQGSTPSISQKTLSEWGRRSTDTSLSEEERNKYLEALKFHDKYQKIITDPKKRRRLRKLVAKQEFKQELNKEFELVKDASDKAKAVKEKEQKSKDSNAKSDPTAASTDPAATPEPSPTVTPVHKRPGSP